MIKNWKNLKLNLPRKNDLYTFEEVLGKINQYGLEIFIPLLKPEDTVIDLGAHIGLFSLAVSSHVKKVFAVEPDIGNYLTLLDNISRNNISNVIAINKAVAKKTGTKKFFQSKLSPARHSFYANAFLNNDGMSSEIIKVPTISLSTILSQMDSCKLLKADIEGAEYEVLFNCPAADLKKIQLFLLEYHNISEKYNKKAPELFFTKLGFQVISEHETVHSKQGPEFIGGNLLILNTKT